MLLEFAISNYKCFTDEIVFSMKPTNIRELDYSILKSKKESVKALSSAVIYGPNASGKTNMIGALETLQNIIKRGHIRNEDNTGSPNYAKSRLELIPNYKANENTPVKFRIKFFYKELLVEYLLSLKLGSFLQINANRFVEQEILTINDKMIYDRTKSNIEIGNINVIEKFLIKGFSEKHSYQIANNNPNDEELFLCNMFKNLYSNILAGLIIEWFDDKLNVIYSCNDLVCIPEYVQGNKNELPVDNTLNSALSEFGLFASTIVYKESPESSKMIPLSLIRKGNTKENTYAGIDSNIVESFGTIRFMNIFPLIIDAIALGQTLVVDEFDASIHPMALMSIINIFHNDEVNKNNSQLIFNTHNPIFLSNNLFRRDEIKFVEYDEIEKIYTHYSLSDFGTKAPGGVRNTENYMNNYFMSKYGAIKDIDFTPIFEKAVEKEMQNEKNH